MYILPEYWVAPLCAFLIYITYQKKMLVGQQRYYKLYFMVGVRK
jgi:hypothetical protein